MRNHVQLFKLIVVLMSLHLLTGCWDIKEIQDINYITAIGVDYEDDHYILYSQMIDFTSIAKTEGGKSATPSQIWVSRTTGKTLDAAINNIYDSAQVRTIWGHISSIVISERALSQGVIYKMDTIARFQEVRMTPWVYGTRDSIEELFYTPAFFNLSPLNTMLHEPLEEYKQKSVIAPIRFFDFAAEVTEPGYTVILPNLTINKVTWSTQDKRDPKLAIDGAFMLSEDKLLGYLDNVKLSGLRWMSHFTRRSHLPIHNEGNYSGVVVLKNPRIRKELVMEQGKPVFNIHVRLHGNVVEILEKYSKHELENQAAVQVRKEILDTFNNSINIKADVYSLEHVFFKKNMKLWRQQQGKEGMLHIDGESLNAVKVEVFLDHVGMKVLHQGE
ncbi:Ger(x)C family spore germination protein [Paenibacillus sp. JCM 10914]|uniref:Ger(x)C family spore germination protein n=1 Tax=Paenibacillus sp. JCM 10914 TaxID=1236974 RepID=UPI0003CC88C3|nr:Ger(x)C family spore germination protein [Paenibacillus sp. JCM 10914]GAE09192.1 spore germination protein xc. bacillus [Paenibacillus sp. JCM 10914]